ATLISLILLSTVHLDSLGIGYAVVSGAITSGIGYVIWYAALPGLKAASAATVQLSVPVLAATGGILLLGERITSRYIIASIAVLGGIAMVIIEKQRASRNDFGGSTSRKRWRSYLSFIFIFFAPSSSVTNFRLTTGAISRRRRCQSCARPGGKFP